MVFATTQEIVQGVLLGYGLITLIDYVTKRKKRETYSVAAGYQAPYKVPQGYWIHRNMRSRFNTAFF